jgi:exodeoxyribonuclease V alpha subunit
LQNALEVLSSDAYRDVSWRQIQPARSLPAAVRDEALRAYRHLLETDEPVEALARLGEFQILCAVRSGVFGVTELNRLVEQSLVDAGLLKKEGPWYCGRPVMITQNDYNLRLFNGDVGIVLADKEANGEMRVFFAHADGLRKFPPSRLPQNETVFAMTIHKSQGSEFDSILIVLPGEDLPILTRELIYTGLTRARNHIEIWSPETVLRATISKRVSRSSGLRDALWNNPDYTQLMIPI